MFHKEICFDYELVPLSMASHRMFYNESKSAWVEEPWTRRHTARSPSQHHRIVEKTLCTVYALWAIFVNFLFKLCS